MPFSQKFDDPDARFAWKLSVLTWLAVAAMGLWLATGMLVLRFTLDTVDISCVLGFAALYGTMGWYHLFRKSVPDPKIVLSLTAISQLVFIVAFMGPLTYVVGALNFPLQDKLFLAIDRALGLDPKTWLDFVDARPELAQWLEAAYGMIRWPLIGVPIVLAMTAKYRRLQVFVLAFAIALTITLIISALVPAIGTYYGLGLDAHSMNHLNTRFYVLQLRDIPALRDGSLRDLELFKLAGIVAFPSFHAASAILYAWALGPVRWFGPPAILINALMLIATPVIGAHYVIDVIGGVAVACVSVLLAERAATSLLRPAVQSAKTSAVATA